jgi:hypothetical protein
VLARAGSKAPRLGGGRRKARGWSRFANSASDRVLAFDEYLVVTNLGLLREIGQCHYRCGWDIK